MRILNSYYGSGVTLTASDGLVIVGGSVVNEGTDKAAIYAPSGVNADIRNAGLIGDAFTGTGIRLKSGGTVTNGAANVRDALITGGQYAILAYSSLKLANYGTISTANYRAVQIQGTAIVKNGSLSDQTALIASSTGVALNLLGAATVTNLGTIEGGLSNAINLSGGGTVINGAATTATQSKIVGGGAGVLVGAPASTIINFGSIQGQLYSGAGVGAFFHTPVLKITNGSATSTAATITGNYGIYSNSAAATISNFGTIEGVRTALSRNGDGVLMNGGRLTNGSATSTAALIEGHFVGVLVTGAATINNFARITGGFGAILEGADVVTNGSAADHTATIGGGIDGIDVSGTVGVTITNYGTIAGAVAAIDFDAGADQLVVEAGSLLSGVVDGGAGGDTVTFAAGGAHAIGNFRAFEVFDLFTGAANTLTLTNANFAHALGGVIQVNGGAGGDKVSAGAAGAGFSLGFLGGSGADIAVGGGGADVLNTGGGLDTLTGGGGVDVLVGGAAADTFRYLKTSDSTSGGHSDTITDFTAGSAADHDLIDLSAIAGVTTLQGLITPASPSETPPATGLHAHAVAWYQAGAETVVLVNNTGTANHVSMEILLSDVTASSLSATAGVNFLLHPPGAPKPAALAQAAAALAPAPAAATALPHASGRAEAAQLLALPSHT